MQNENEILQPLFEVHFPGCSLLTYCKPNISLNQPSEEDWEQANKLVSEDRVMWAISLFAPYKAAGLGGIFPALMHMGLEIIIKPLIRIFRACIALGYVPTAWRTSHVAFAPKPGRSDYSQAKAFRPISLTSFSLKTLERLIDTCRYIRNSVLLVH